MRWYLKVIRRSTDFKGRASRTEYWNFYGINFLVGVLFMLLDNLLDTTFHLSNGTAAKFGYCFVVYHLLMLLPGTAVSVRRLHDTGRSGWMLLVGLIPVLGALWLLYVFAERGEEDAAREVAE